MGVLSRMSTVFKSKLNRVLDRVEDPRETLDYSYEKQLELLQKVKRGLAEVVASKKRLEMQEATLRQQMLKYENQAKEALKLGREDLATKALERKAQIAGSIDGLSEQVKQLEAEQEKLAANEARLRTKVESFRTQKEVIKAQYSAAEAQVRIGEATTGLSEEMSDVGMAIERAQQKTDNMRSRAAAIDELVEDGTFEPVLGKPTDDVEQELAKLSRSQSVSADLERLKKEVNAK